MPRSLRRGPFHLRQHGQLLEREGTSTDSNRDTSGEPVSGSITYSIFANQCVHVRRCTAEQLRKADGRSHDILRVVVTDRAPEWYARRDLLDNEF